MGKMETASARQIRNTKIQRVVLQTVAAAGVLSVALLAPNAFQALAIVNPSLRSRKRRSINSSRQRLLEHGLLAYRDGFLSLTKKGETKLRQIELHEYTIKHPKRWDKKWRILIFDIPERRKSLREKVRTTLTALGFKRLQDSVWVYPYDCEDLMTLLKADFRIGKDMLYLIVDFIEHDRALKKSFGLPVATDEKHHR